MSSVNSASDRSTNEDTVRRTRDAYTKNEAENAKKNSNKLKQLSEAHQAEVQELQQEHTKQIGELQDKTRDTISRRDMQHQKEIDELRDLHQRQLQRTAAEAELRVQPENAALKSEIGRVRATNEDQKQNMEKNFEGHIQEGQKELEDYSVRARQSQQEAEENTKSRMSESKDKETKALIQDRDQRVAQLKHEMEVTRSTKDQQLKHLQNEKDMQAGRLSSEFEQNLKTQWSDNNASQLSMRDRLAQEVKRNSERFDVATAGYRDEQLQARENLERNVGDREEARIRALEFENKNLKDDEPRIRETMQRQKQIELSNQRQSLGDNIRQSEESRKQIVDATNANVKSNIARIVDGNSKQIGDTHRLYKDKMAMNDLRENERFQALQVESERRLSQEKLGSDARLGKIRTVSELDQEKQRAYFERATGIMKENFEDRLREIRDHNKREQDAMFSLFTRQGQENDAKFQDKLNTLSTKYERQIAEMQDAHTKELQDQFSVSEKEKKEIEKKSQLESQTAAIQYERRIAKLDEAHKKDIETMQRKNQEMLANLTKTRQA